MQRSANLTGWQIFFASAESCTVHFSLIGQNSMEEVNELQRKIIRKITSFAVLIAVMAISFTPKALSELPDLHGHKLIPMGRTTGIKLYSEGAMIVSFADGASPARDAGLKTGDVIVAVNEKDVHSNAELQEALKGLAGSQVAVTVSRDGMERRFRLVPLCGAHEGEARIGAWVRDSMAGIGTITFVDPQSGTFGALGHGICDLDTGELMPFDSGSTMRSTVSSVTRGKAGEPGTLNGQYDLESDSGVIVKNTEGGIFGRLTDCTLYQNCDAVELAQSGQVKTGKATILSNVSGDRVEQYDAEILKIYNGDNGLRDMMIKVTDHRLLQKTGGIVQGMSGSPIIQDGKLIGAVTHVLVNDPTRGYGIFIENMLEAADQEA